MKHSRQHQDLLSASLWRDKWLFHVEGGGEEPCKIARIHKSSEHLAQLSSTILMCVTMIHPVKSLQDLLLALPFSQGAPSWSSDESSTSRHWATASAKPVSRCLACAVGGGSLLFEKVIVMHCEGIRSTLGPRGAIVSPSRNGC
jgi:hypothetical protein